MSESKKLMKEGQDVLMSEETTMYVLDTSGSMKDFMGEKASFAGTKLEAMKKAVIAALEQRLISGGVDKLGVVVFGGVGNKGVKLLFKPSIPDKSYIISVRSVCASGLTPMYEALKRAQDILEMSDGLVRVVLVSDGEPNGVHGKGDVERLVTCMAQDYGYVIDTVGIGTDFSLDYDEIFMKRLASLGEGEFYPVSSADELLSRFLEMERERRSLIGDGIKLLRAGY